MEKIESIEQYQQLRKDVQGKYHRVATNNYMFPPQVERYISLGRLYADTFEAGVVFYTDEDTHYKAYFSVSAEVPFRILPKDKPVYMRNIYTEGKKKADLLQVEKSLTDSGFQCMNTSAYVVGNPEIALAKINKSYQNAEKILKKNGFQLMPLPIERLDEFIELQKHMDMIPFYELSYHTKAEYTEEIEAGHILCVVDQNGKICACRHHYEEANSLSGWNYVEPEYQKAYGIAVVLTHSVLEYAKNHNNMSVHGWILINNVDSIKYHKRLEYVWTSRMSDEWLLEN